ncbi:hypothetical protein BKA80DRAFT_51723 [Phyllosticta citrichinensis]
MRWLAVGNKRMVGTAASHTHYYLSCPIRKRRSRPPYFLRLVLASAPGSEHTGWPEQISSRQQQQQQCLFLLRPPRVPTPCQKIEIDLPRGGTRKDKQAEADGLDLLREQMTDLRVRLERTVATEALLAKQAGGCRQSLFKQNMATCIFGCAVMFAMLVLSS